MKLKSDEEILKSEIRKEIIDGIATSADSTKRKAEHIKRSEIFNDRTREYVLLALQEEMGKASALEIKHRTPNLSITKLIVNKKARVYKDRPVREPEKKKQKKTLDKLVDILGFDTFMKFVNRRVELHKNILVKVLPVKKAEKEYSIGTEIMNPANFDVIPDPYDPTKPMVVILSFPRHDVQFLSDYRSGEANQQKISQPKASNDKTKNLGGENIYIWWSENYHFTTDDKGAILKGIGKEKEEDEVENDFGVLPFVSIAKEQEGTFWVDGGEGLSDNAILINQLLADLNYSAKYQSVGIGYIIGSSIPKEIVMGPSKFLKMERKEGEEAPQVGFATPNPKLTENMQLIEQQLAFFLTSEGMEPGAISGKLDSASANSGVQEIIQKSEPTTNIEDEQQLYKDKEPEIIHLIAKIISVLKERNVMCEEIKEVSDIDPELEYVLSFARPKAYTSDKELLDVVKAKKDSGLYTDEELLQELHPDWGDEEIQAQLTKLEEIKAKAVAEQQAFMASQAIDPNEDEPVDPNDPEGKKKVPPVKKPVEEDPNANKQKQGNKNSGARFGRNPKK